MNSVNLVGRVVRDIELKYTGNGTAVANFTVAVDRRFKNAEGEYEADFIDVVVWRQSAEFASKYFKKGEPIAIQGSIQTRNYENNEGRKVYVTEVVADNVSFVPQPPKGQSQQASGPFEQATPASNPFTQKPDITDEELPF